MKRTLVCLLSAAIICVVSTGAAWAQGTAHISGTVRDQSGAVLPGVEITATQTDTGIARMTITNETGAFVLPNIPIGPYRLEAALPGFRTYVQTGIVLQVNSNPVINAVLEVGQVTEQVVVQANAAMVETRNVGVGAIIENQRILELPLNGRQVTDLIVLSGAAVQTTPAVPDRNMPQVVAVSVGGGLSTGTVYMLDGAMHNDPYSNYNLPLPFPDALQEFRVETGARSAQSGMYSGATVNSVTKAGTNEFHGSLFEFVRNDLFNARNFFATTNSTLKRNQFGGTIGGPIAQNKLFFFAGIQGTTLRQDPADERAFVPTPQMLAGDFTAITSPQCRAAGQLNLQGPFVGNRIDPRQFSPAAVNIANKLPKTNDPCGLVTYGVKRPENEGQYIGRVDYQHNANHSMFGRSVVTIWKQPVPYTLDPNLLNTPVLGGDKRGQSYAFGDTLLLGPNVVNSFRLAVNRTTIERLPAEYFSPSSVGVRNWFDYSPTHMTMSVTGGFSLGVPFGPIRNTTYSMANDVSLVRGSHQLAIGATLAHWRSNLFAMTNPSLGGFSFTGQETGLGLADFLTGRLTQTSQRSPSETRMSKWYLGAYIADVWQARPGLTFNYGVRWEPYFPQVMRDGEISIFNEERYAAGRRSEVFVNSPAGLLYPGDESFPGVSCRDSGICKASGQEYKWSEVMPRIGLAWDVKGDGTMSVRASYALGKDMISGGFYNNFITPPLSSSVIFQGPPGGFDDPWAGYPGGNPFPPALPPSADIAFPPFSNYIYVQQDAPQTTRHSWSLSLERQLVSSFVASASYMGSQAHHLWNARQVNSAIFFPGNFDANRQCRTGGYLLTGGNPGTPCSTVGNTNQRRRLALQYPNVTGTPMGFLNEYNVGGTQSYNGLLLSLQRRAARGVNVSANYTWSHCYGDDALASQGGSGGSTYTDPNNRDFDRGNCEGDRRHVFNMTAVADLPQFTNRALRTIVTGWRLSGIYRKSTGAPLNVTSGQNRALTGVSDQRPQQILGNPYGDRSINNFLNPAAFTLPELGSLGNMSPRSIAGPGTWAFDASLSRTFAFSEEKRLEARFEAYNVTNSMRPGTPVTNLTTNNFGKIDRSLDPRILQFALKFIF